jgi:hypothetical protein
MADLILLMPEWGNAIQVRIRIVFATFLEGNTQNLTSLIYYSSNVSVC